MIKAMVKWNAGPRAAIDREREGSSVYVVEDVVRGSQRTGAVANSESGAGDKRIARQRKLPVRR
jgi:hypothetical protein